MHCRISWFLSLRAVHQTSPNTSCLAMRPRRTVSAHSIQPGDNRRMAAMSTCALHGCRPCCRLAFTRALPTRRAFLTHPLRSRALARARCAWHAKTQVKRFTANRKSICFVLAHKLAEITAMPHVKYVYFPGNLRVQCVCLPLPLLDSLPRAACTGCRCVKQQFLTCQASKHTMPTAMQHTASLGSRTQSMSLAMAHHSVMAFRFGKSLPCEFFVCGEVFHCVSGRLLARA